MPIGGKLSKDKPKSSQPKLTDFGSQSAERIANKEAAAASMEDGADSRCGSSDAVSGTGKDQQLLMVKDAILGEIRNLKEEFTGRFDGVLKAIEETRKEILDCTERLTQAEVRLSTAEDEQVNLKSAVERLEKRNKYLEDKVIDAETRSRLNNLRAVGLPEGSEGHDMCAFLENWLPEALDLTHMRAPLVLERAHRVGPKRDNDAPPRPVIMRFLNYKQKDMVFKAAKVKKDVLYKNRRVRLYIDMATEVHRQRKQFDGVREQLRQLGVRHGILSPATLVLTYNEVVHKFTSPEEAKNFVRRIQLGSTENN